MEQKITHNYATPKHVFLHLLMIAMLYVSVIALITLYFQYANQIFFDQAFSNRYSIFDSIRWASSILLISYPVLVYTSWLIYRELRKQMELLQMKTRRWLLYFTQFITALTIIIDLMVLVYEFYGGEITSRFICKVVVVLVVAAVVLGYYRWELHHAGEKSQLPKWMAIGVGVFLAGSIVSGFFIAGSPAEQRALRLDEQRVNDLMTIQSYVVSYSQGKSALPKTLADLEGWAGPLPTDPETEQPFTYTKTSATTFELCAVFGAAQDEDPYGQYYGPSYATTPEKMPPQLIGGSSWLHPAGSYCFPRTIDFAVEQPQD